MSTSAQAQVYVQERQLVLVGACLPACDRVYDFVETFQESNATTASLYYVPGTTAWWVVPVSCACLAACDNLYNYTSIFKQARGHCTLK